MGDTGPEDTDVIRQNAVLSSFAAGQLGLDELGNNLIDLVLFNEQLGNEGTQGLGKVERAAQLLNLRNSGALFNAACAFFHKGA